MGPWRWPLLWCLMRSTFLTGGQRPQERPPQPAGWSPATSSSWAPTPEPGASGDLEGSAAALAFLQTGDAQRLARANCSRGVVTGAAGLGPPPALRAALRAAPEALAHAANFLNMLFQTNDIREASVAEDVEWYQALVRSLAEGHPWVRRAVLALDAHPLAAKPRLMLQATKVDGEILLQDISAAATPSLGNLSWDNEWFNTLKSQRDPQLRKRVLSNDLRTMDTPKWQRGDSYVGEPGHVRWSPPFLECQDGRFLPAWAITLSSAFYGLKPDLSPEFKGVVRVDIELRDVPINQCASGPGWFSDTHRCDLNSTQCVPQESRGFVLGRYLCRCKPGFYRAGGCHSQPQGSVVGADGGSRLSCRPCRQGCATCEDDAPCLIQEDRALRAAILSCQACCMLAVFLSMLVSYHFRRSKRIRASGLVLLETILFGSLLLYFPVFILYFKPSIFRCIVLRWVRMLGFTIVYGTITLKLYRVLKVFLSRTAQRVPYVSSGRVLKMLGLILLLVLWFLAAWTVGMLENVEKNIPLVIRTQTTRGLHFYICGHDRWDYMMVIAEMLFLLWGSFLCYATRAVPSAFHEPRYMGIALHNELMISAAFHVVRFVMVPSLHPDWTLLLFFAHTHGTITTTLALLFIPKFLHAGSPLREEIAAEVYEDELDMRRSGSCLNSSIASAWSEHSLDPDDIREELRKLYTQLEVHKTRKMAANNPHLPKKRGSRRSLGRSIVRRIAELPDAVSRRSSGGGERLGALTRHGSSAKRLADAGSTGSRIKDDGSRRRSSTLRTSRSTESSAPEPRGASPAPTELTEGRMMMVRAPEQSDSESLDAAPLVCKSASAQNLSGHEQPPLPRAPPLHKSLSVVAGAREEALLAACRAAREEWHANRHPTPSSEHPTGQGPPKEARKLQSSSTADVLLPDGSSPAEGCSPEDVSPPTDGKVQKRVTYAPIKSVSIDSSHVPGRVRVAVRRTPPPPPVRYQSLVQRATPAQDGPEPAEPLAQAGKPVGTPEGTPEEDEGCASPPAGKGRLLAAASIPAQVCPWELVQEEILSQKQKAIEAAASGTPGDTAATPPSMKPSSQKTSLRGLGLALKAFSRSRGKSILKGRRDGEGSLRKRGHEGGSRRERPSLAGSVSVALGRTRQDPTTTQSPEGGGQRSSSEPTTHPWQGEMVPCQHNNNAGSAGDGTGWGYSGEGAEGQWDGPALVTGDGEKLAEEPSAPQEDTGRGSGVHRTPASIGHQGGAQHPHGMVTGGNGKAEGCPQRGDDAAVVEPAKDAPAAITPQEGGAGPAEGLEGGSKSIPPQEHPETEQPRVKPVTGSPHPSTPCAEKKGAEVCPWGPPGGRGTLLRQGAIAAQDDSGVPAKALEKGGSHPEPLGPGGSWGTERVPVKSQSLEVTLGAGGQGSSRAGKGAGVHPGENQAESSGKRDICPWEESEGERWGPGRAPGKGSEGDSSCPGKELGLGKPPVKSPELLQAAPEAAGRTEGRRAEVCPWESREGGSTVRAEICPWDVEGAQPEPERLEGERRQLTKWVKSIRPTSPGLQRAQEGESSPRAPGWPWGSPSSEGPPPKPAPKSSELPEVTLRSPTSSRASVCPWEAAGVERDAEVVCPWGRGTASPQAGKLDEGEASQGKDGISQLRAAPRGTGEMDLAVTKGRGQGASPSPGEGAERPSPGLAAAQQGGITQGKKADVCPWEVEDQLLPRAEICPWEEPAAPAGKERPSQDTCGTSKGENKPGSGGLEGIRAKLVEMGSHQPELRDTGGVAKLVCKSLQASKVESKKSQSVESIREEVCPWESLDTELPPEQPRARSPVLPKSPSRKPQSQESLKAEVCPWEMEPTERAEICPWEAAAPPPDEPKAKGGLGGASKGDKHIRRQAALASPVISLEKGSSESVCPWESLGMEQPLEQPRARSPALPKSPSRKPQSQESLKAEVCPWELEPTERAEICPWEAVAPPAGKEKSRQDRDGPSLVSGSSSVGQGLCKDTRDTTSAKEKVSRDRESVCPWESTDTEHHSTGYSRKSAELPKATKRSESTGSTRPEVCPWESLGMEQPPEQPRARSPVLPKSPSRKPQSQESLKAEVCPWELEVTERAEICPWEVAAPLPEKGEALGEMRLPRKPAGSSGAQEERSSERESVCPWESLGMELPFPKTTVGKEPTKEPDSTESRKSAVCPWEGAEPPSSGEESSTPGLCPPGAGRASPTGLGKPELAAGAGAAAPAALLKASRHGSLGEAEHKPLCRVLPGTQPPRGPRAGPLPRGVSTAPAAGSSPSPSPSITEVCPWEAEEALPAPAKPSRDPRKTSEVCPWEMESGDPTPGVGRAGVSPQDRGASDTQADVCPWDHE
ncbi:putative G-protein coupled receptor 179 [Porphyrio hochstetteri]